jgi:hypothetical protein
MIEGNISLSDQPIKVTTIPSHPITFKELFHQLHWGDPIYNGIKCKRKKRKEKELYEDRKNNGVLYIAKQFDTTVFPRLQIAYH